MLLTRRPRHWLIDMPNSVSAALSQPALLHVGELKAISECFRLVSGKTPGVARPGYVRSYCLAGMLRFAQLEAFLVPAHPA